MVHRCVRFANYYNTNSIRIVFDNINVIKIINMYEAIEHWKQYNQEKHALAELDALINSLIAKNGTTKY